MGEVGQSAAQYWVGVWSIEGWKHAQGVEFLSARIFIILCLLPVRVYSLVIFALPGRGNWLRYEETQVCHYLCSRTLAC